MHTKKFPIEVVNEVPNLNLAIIKNAEERIRSLADSRDDIIGAAFSLKKLSSGETTYLYEAGLVVYMHPEHLSAAHREETVAGAINGALSAVGRQIREGRDRAREQSLRPDLVDGAIYTLSPRALYDTFAEQAKPGLLLDHDRDALATRLMLEESLGQEAAYFAADRILEYSQRL